MYSSVHSNGGTRSCSADRNRWVCGVFRAFERLFLWLDSLKCQRVRAPTKFSPKLLQVYSFRLTQSPTFGEGPLRWPTSAGPKCSLQRFACSFCGVSANHSRLLIKLIVDLGLLFAEVFVPWHDVYQKVELLAPRNRHAYVTLLKISALASKSPTTT